MLDSSRSLQRKRPAMEATGERLRRLRRLPALAWLCTCVLPVAAQVAQPVSPGALVPTPAELAPKPPPPRSDAALVPPQPAAVPREIGKPQDELVLDVSAYRVADDAPAALRAALPRLTAPYVGTRRGYEDLVNAAAEVTRFLQRDLGYYLGYAYIPEQTPSDGVVRIQVLEGRLDRVELRWDDKLPVKREVVQAYLDRLRPGDILSVRDVERVVFLVNDLRGIAARFDIQPGRTPGTAALVVTPSAEPRYTTKLDFDSNGSRFMGGQRLAALWSANSLAGRGDALTLNAMTSFSGGLAFALAGYTLPVGSDGVKLGASLSAMRYKLDQTDFPLGVNGDATNLTLYGMYPWVRSRNLNLFTVASLESKHFTDRRDVSGTSESKQVNSLSLGVSGDFRDAWFTGGVNTYELNLSTGQVRYAAGMPAGLDDSPNYSKLLASYARVQNLVTGRLLLYAALRAQQAMKNLDTTEQFRLGGPDGVRAFAPGEGTGDSGQLATIELRLLPPDDWWGRWSRETVLALFYDAGHVTLRHDPSQRLSSFVNTASFTGAGFSLSWARGNDYALRLSIAKPLSGTPKADNLVRNPRLYLQLTKLF